MDAFPGDTLRPTRHSGMSDPSDHRVPHVMAATDLVIASLRLKVPRREANIK